MDLLNENISHEDLKKNIKELYNYASKELNIDTPPRLFLRRDKDNAGDILGKTGGYDPDNKEVHLYIIDRHPKDILRSLVHELVHHAQNLVGFDDNLNIGLIHKDPAYAQHDKGLREMERDAFERGNMIFRDWCDKKKMERNTIMAEMKNPQKKAKKMTLSMKKQNGTKKGQELESPKKADLNKDGKLSGYEKKRGSAIEKSMRTQAEAQAKVDMAARNGKDLDEDLDEDISSGGAVESVETLEENKESEQTYPYPQLFEEKPRLLGDAFNKKEELVYQELIRRFIKK